MTGEFEGSPPGVRPSMLEAWRIWFDLEDETSCGVSGRRPDEELAEPGWLK